jgi:hypothetical protein
MRKSLVREDPDEAKGPKSRGLTRLEEHTMQTSSGGGRVRDFPCDLGG